MRRGATLASAWVLAACSDPAPSGFVSGGPGPNFGGGFVATADGGSTDGGDLAGGDGAEGGASDTISAPLGDAAGDQGAPPEDAAALEPDLGQPEPDLGQPEPDAGPGEPDPGPPEPDVGPGDPDLPPPPPPCAGCGTDQVCQAATCVPACQGGCECLPAYDACPEPPGGGLVAGAATPNAVDHLMALAAASESWADCTGGDEVACHRFLRAATWALYQKDPNWGLLSKVPGQNQCTWDDCGNDVACGYAADAIIYRASNQVIDIITGIGAPGSQVAWQLVGKLDYNHWTPPTCVPDEGATPGGGCDDCGPDQACPGNACVPACQGGCECLPAADACPNPPGGGVVAGAQTPDEYGSLLAYSGESEHWGACHDGDEVACHIFLRAWVLAMYQKDPNWGLLSKKPGQNQCTLTDCGNDVACGYAADAIIYRATNQVIDIITGIGAPGSKVAWQLVGKLDYNNWAPPTCLPGSVGPGASDTLAPGEGLAAGQKRVSSDGRFQLEYQSDGDLVHTFLGVGPLWSSGTKSAPGSAQMQGDGNLVVYDAGGTPLWASDTAGNPGAKLVLQNDGNAVVYDGGGAPIWATDTCCY